MPGSIHRTDPELNAMERRIARSNPAAALVIDAANAATTHANSEKIANTVLGPIHSAMWIPAALVTTAPITSVASASETACEVGPHKYPLIATIGSTGMSRWDSIIRELMSP